MRDLGRVRAAIAAAAVAAGAGAMLSGASQSQTTNGVDAKVAADALHWRLVGPFRAGRVNAVSGVPGQPDTFYFGSVGGGVWKTENAGRTWSPIFDSTGTGSIGASGAARADIGSALFICCSLLRRRHWPRSRCGSASDTVLPFFPPISARISSSSRSTARKAGSICG